MIYTDNTKKAMKIAYEAHQGQTDKNGIPYIFHPFHLAEQMNDEDTTACALLHDVIEDTDYTIEDMRRLGFSQNITDALSLLTHDKDVPYMEYVEKIKGNPIASMVKLADLRHNSDITRLDKIDEHTRERIVKYQKAIAVLIGEDDG